MRPLLVCALVFGLCGCGPIDRAPTPPPSPGTRAAARVTRVVDGDTIHVSLDAQDITVRLIGVDSPETVDPNRPVGCYGEQASDFVTAQLTDARVTLEFDRDPTDPFGRTLAYVWLEGRLFNEVLVEQGYAEAKSYPPNTRYQSALDAAEDRARSIGNGIWGAC